MWIFRSPGSVAINKKTVFRVPDTPSAWVEVIVLRSSKLRIALISGAVLRAECAGYFRILLPTPLMGRIGRYYAYESPRARKKIALMAHALYIKPAART